MINTEIQISITEIIWLGNELLDTHTTTMGKIAVQIYALKIYIAQNWQQVTKFG